LKSLFLFSNAIVALGALALSFETYSVLSDFNPGCYLLIFVFASTVFLYIMHRLHGVKSLKGDIHIERVDWVRRHKKPLFLVALIHGSVALVCTFYMNMIMLILLVPIGLISFFYTVPFIKVGGVNISLRKIPIIKIGLIALVWTLVTVLLPVLDIRGEFSLLDGEVILLMFERFLFIFAITIPFDVRDISLDKASRVVTIPKLIGFRNSIVLSIAILIVAMGTAMILFLTTSLYSLFQVIAIGLVYLAAIILVSRTKQESDDYFYLGWLDGTMIIHGLVVSIIVWLPEHFI